MSLFAAHGLTANTIHIQLRFALSNTTTWCVVDIDFSNVDFYTAIVDFFEVNPGPRNQAKADELLVWWNRSAIILPFIAITDNALY